ncbi:hypothetical protein DFP72DRAFT_874045 [Ephemerocybe angulata]|uniref:Nudix hydrolase domain-containing protein n=1 Tax=Ephemerocybe angulata TaxID=980116 RepID=A0A8H6IH26_9AGAR|nr:hypothetical protein DFP72DRAFT_874045 [Tulosesus angulatus]
MLPLPVRCMAITRLSLVSRGISGLFTTRIALHCWPVLLHVHPLASAMSTRATVTESTQPSPSVAIKPPPPVPRSSASLVIVNARNEVLLVERNPKASAFGGMHKQDASLEITAIRETFEESGLLLASGADSKGTAGAAHLDVSESVLDEARFAIHQQKKLFQAFLSEQGLKADVDSLLPFTEWVTPVGPPKRFRTQFYVTFLSPSPSAGFSSGQKQERLPTPDGGQEVIAAKFVSPSDAIAASKAHKMNFMPPQYYILSTLADILKGTTNTAEQRDQVKKLSQGAFGKLVINPLGVGRTDDGRTILAYEGDETRGGFEKGVRLSLLQLLNAALTGCVDSCRDFSCAKLRYLLGH